MRLGPFLTSVIRSASVPYRISARTMAVDIGGMRKPYHDKSETFDMKDLVSREPFGQFKAWFEEATAHENIEEANAMCLSTATKEGLPSARMVLLKKYGPEGFTFYTNYSSRKAGELDSNPHASLVFYWPPLKRSVRVEGEVHRVPEAESEEYFLSRPLASQLGACVSEQSRVVKDRAVLDERNERLKEKYGSGEEKVERPDWGGYRVVPRVVEFWQGQSNRIHDRLLFRHLGVGEVLDPDNTHEGEGGWVIERLQP